MTSIHPADDHYFEESVGRLIVCEHDSRWAVALRRELGDAGIRIHQTRSVSDGWQVLQSAPASFVVVEATISNLANLLRPMASLGRDFFRARLAVVSQACLKSHEWSLREAGAVHVAYSTRDAGQLAAIVLRHFAALPPPRQTFRQRIWSSLPWRG